MVSSPQTSPVRSGDVFKRIDFDFATRRETILAGSGAVRSLVCGEVVGKLTKSSTATTNATNTGNGTVGAVTLGAKAKVGTYQLKCIVAATDAGVFQVLDPDGLRLADLTVAVAYVSDHINLTIGDGSTDWIVGDDIQIAVTGSGKIVALTPAAVNGSQHAYGLMLEDITAPDGTDNPDGVVVVGPAVVAASKVTWPAGISAGDKAAAIATLAEKGILIRSDV